MAKPTKADLQSLSYMQEALPFCNIGATDNVVLDTLSYMLEAFPFTGVGGNAPVTGHIASINGIAWEHVKSYCGIEQAHIKTALGVEG